MAFSKQQREKIHSKYNGKCAYCGCEITVKQMQVDHIIPQREFLHHVKNKIRIPYFLTHLTELDVNNEDNLNPACVVCNKWKSADDLELFRSQLYHQIKRLNAYSSNYRLAKRYGLLEEKLKPIKFHFEQYISNSFDWEAFKTYVNTYDPNLHGANNQGIIMNDMLYGIGLSINKEQYQWADGYRRFKVYLKELFAVKPSF